MLFLFLSFRIKLAVTVVVCLNFLFSEEVHVTPHQCIEVVEVEIIFGYMTSHVLDLDNRHSAP